MSGWCLLREQADKFIKGIRSGEIDTLKLAKLSSEDRHAFLSKYVGEENAKQVNSNFESKLLLKNQQKGLENWIKRTTASKQIRQGLLERVQKMDRILDPKEEESFKKDLASTKLGADVTQEQTKTAFDLSKKAEELQAKSKDSLAGISDEALVARANFKNYIESLKPTSVYKSLGNNLNIIARNNLLLNPATPIKTLVSHISNTLSESITRRLTYLSLKGQNPGLVSKALSEAWTTFKKTGANVASMESLDDVHSLNKGENFTTPKGDINAGTALTAVNVVVGKAAGISNKVAIDWEHNIPFTKVYQQNFFDMANIIASDMAKRGDLTGIELKTKAAKIFKDAAKIEPETDEGRIVRMLSQKQAARVTSTNDTWASKLSLGVKDTLNRLSPNFPIGNIISPILKIPANIIANGIENSGFGLPKALNDIFQGRSKLQSESLTAKYEGLGQFRQGMQSLLRIGGTLGVAALITSKLNQDDFKDDKYGNHFFRIGSTWINTEYIAAISPALAGMMMVKQKYQEGQSKVDTATQYTAGAFSGLKNLPGISEINSVIQDLTNPNFSKGIQAYATNFFTSRSTPAFVKSLQSDNPIKQLFLGKTGVQTDQELLQAKQAASEKNIVNKNWNEKPTNEQKAFLDKVGKDKFTQANTSFNNQYDNWFKTVDKTPAYQKMDAKAQQSLMDAKRADLQVKIFKSYGFKYKEAKSDKVEAKQRKTTIKKML